MEQKPTPMTEGEMARLAEGLRAVADVQEKAIPLGLLQAKIGTTQRLRAMVYLLRRGASAIEQLLETLHGAEDVDAALAQQKLDDQP